MKTKLNYRISATIWIALVGTLCSLTPTISHADSSNHQAANFASHSGNILFLAASVGLPLLEHGGKRGWNQSLRTADSIGSAIAVTESLKLLVREQRPNGSDHDSFPSGHATAAFAAATAASNYYPKQAPYWYLGATLISLSRVTLREHYYKDIVAGAAIGYGTTRLELSMPRGLILSPLILPHSKNAGFQLSERF